MKIDNLNLTNFRNHQVTEVELAHVNFFLGINGAGKSGIRAGIELALTGAVQGWTDKRGAGSQDLIRNGQKAASVGLTLDGKTLTRTLPGGLEIAGASGNSTVQEALLYQALKTTPEVVTALLNVRAFIELPPKEQKDMIFSLLGIRVTAQGLQDKIMEAKTVPLEIARDLTDTVFPEEDPEAALTIEATIDVLEKQAREKRTTVGRDVKQLEGTLKTLADKETGTADVDGIPRAIFNKGLESLEMIQAGLVDLNGQRDELLAKGGAEEATTDVRSEKEAELTRLKEENEPRLEGLNVPKDKSATKKMVTDAKKFQKETDTAVEILTETLETDTADWKDVIADIEARQKAVAKFDGDSGMDCPLAEGAEVKCPMSAKAREKVVATLVGELEELTLKKADLGDQVAKTQQDLSTKQSKLKGSQDRQVTLEAAVECSKKIKDLGFEIGKMPASKDKAKDGTDTTEDVKALDERIQKGQNLEKAVSTLLTDKKAAEEGLEAAQTDHEIQEKLVALFGPDGIKSNMLESVLGDVQTGMNDKLGAMMPGYSLQIQADPFDLMVTTPAGAELPQRLLSDSERYRVGVVIQAALAGLTGLGWLILDAADILQGKAKADFMNFLAKISPQFDTVMVFATADGAPAVQDSSGPRIFWVQDGKVTACDAEKVAV